MISSQIIEVGHTLKSKNASAFCFSNRQKPSLQHWPLLFEQILGGFAQTMYVQLQFFDHHAHNFTAKGLIIR